MTNLLLQTKLSIPPGRPQQVSRPHLIAQLQQGLAQRRKLSLISAPAGFGKTTLALEWLAQLDAAAWLALDSGDNDAARFLTYVISALQTIEPGLGRNLSAGLQSPQPQPMRAVASLLNDILSTSRQFVLFLDDYHLIEAGAVHELMTFLLDHLPANLHVVITSRDDPAFPLSRLRIRDELTELRAADLAFSVEETVLFFTEVMDLDIGREDVAALDTRAEGWIAGLQVAGLSMQGRTQAERAQFINTFAGSHRYLLDFLAEEVLARQPQTIQTFLLQTSILTRLSSSLCSAVVEGQEWSLANDDSVDPLVDSQRILEYLEQANLFVTALDHERRWYRYHHLFREFLRHRLQQQHPNRLTSLHQRASEWYEKNGYLTEAVESALDIADYGRAAQLMEQMTQSTIMQFGEWRILLAWMDTLPDEIVRAHPQLSLHYAWGLITNYQVEAAEARLQDAEQHARSNGSDADPKEQTNIRGQAAAIRSTLHRLQGDFPKAVTFARQALANLPETDTFWRPSTALNLATVTYLDDDIATAEATLLEVQSAMLAAQNFNFHLVVTGYLAQLHVRKGDLDRTERIYLQMIASAQEHEATGRFVSATGMAHIGLGDLYRERNDMTQALAQLEQGIALGARVNNNLILLAGQIVTARIQQTQGDRGRAGESIQQAVDMLQEMDVSWTWLTVSNAATQVRLWLDQGEIARAGQIVQTFAIDATPGYVQEAQQVATARYLMATGEPQPAQALLTQLAEKAEQRMRMGSLIEISILQAMNEHSLGNEPDALTYLTRALTLAEPSRYVRLFIDEGPPMAALLRTAAKQKIAPEYVQHLINAFPAAASDAPISNLQPPPTNLVDPLTNRELDVLRLIATGLTNQEIADQLVIAHGTVRQHINRIYSKIDVKNRAQAIFAAQELRLL